MAVWVYLPLLLSAIFGAVAPRLAGALPPAIATWLLSVGGLLSAAGSSASLALLAFVFVAQSPTLAARGRWSDDVLRLHDPLTVPAGVLAIVAVVVFTVRFLRAGTRRLVAVRDAYRLAATLPDNGSELSVLDVAEPQAFAVPGRPGRIVVTTGLLRSLDAKHCRALLAHERAHLTHGHHVHLTAALLAAAINPLLGRLPAAAELLCERWADEDAALECRRDTVAEALIRAASGGRLRHPAGVLAAGVADVALRVGALGRPAPRLTTWRVALPAAVLAVTATATVVAMRDTERLFDLAQTAYLAGRR